MKNWPAEFITELAKKTGLTPCLILRVTIDSVDYHITDHVITFPAGALGGFANVVTKPWVATWGQIHEQISGNIGEILIADMALTLLVDQADDNNIRHLALQHELEKNPTELYLWLPSLDSTLIPPQLVTKGHIEDIDLPDETQVNITIEDETSRLQDYLGTKITSEAYPLADPDIVGKMIPIIFGSVKKLPALCVDSGWISTLPLGLDATSTSMIVSEIPTYSLVNKYVWVEEEIVLVSAQAETTLTVIRGQSATQQVAHIKATVVVEKKNTPLIYLLADHALDTIGTVLARIRGVNVDITAEATKYLGTAGNQLSGYPGRAAISIPDYARVSQKIALALEGDVSVGAGSHTHAAGTVNTTTSVPYTWNAAQVSYTLTATKNMRGVGGNGIYTYYYGICTINYPAGRASGLTRRLSFTLNIPAAAGPVGVYVVNVGWLTSYTPGSGAKQYTFDYNPNFMSRIGDGGNLVQIHVPCFYMNLPVGQMYSYDYIASYLVYVSAISDAGSYNSTTASNVSIAAANTPLTVMNTLRLSGNSVADIYMGDMVLVDCTRNITTPSAVFSNLLSTYCNDTSLVQVGTLPAFYAFNGAITKYKKKIEWFDILAFQCRCWYRKIAGVSKLIVRKAEPDNPVTIPACCLTGEGIKDLRYRKAPKTDVINDINVLYNRDWSSNNSSSESYMSSKRSTDDVSIADYGRIEQPNMFMFDFITSDSMASDVGSFFHDFYAVRKWLILFPTYLDWAHLEFADDVLLPFANDLTGVIVEAGLDLSSGEQMPKIAFTIATTKIPLEVTNGIHTLLGIQVHTKNREAATYV